MNQSKKRHFSEVLLGRKEGLEMEGSLTIDVKKARQIIMLLMSRYLKSIGSQAST